MGCLSMRGSRSILPVDVAEQSELRIRTYQDSAMNDHAHASWRYFMDHSSITLPAAVDGVQCATSTGRMPEQDGFHSLHLIVTVTSTRSPFPSKSRTYILFSSLLLSVEVLASRGAARASKRRKAHPTWYPSRGTASYSCCLECLSCPSIVYRPTQPDARLHPHRTFTQAQHVRGREVSERATPT
jgi:hypothetical protein